MESDRPRQQAGVIAEHRSDPAPSGISNMESGVSAQCKLPCMLAVTRHPGWRKFSGALQRHHRHAGDAGPGAWLHSHWHSLQQYQQDQPPFERRAKLTR